MHKTGRSGSTRNITTINGGFSADCPYAKSVTVLNEENYPNLTKIDATLGLNLTEVNLPKLTYVGQYGLQTSSLEKVYLPGVTYVGNQAFTSEKIATMTLGITNASTQLVASWNYRAKIGTLHLPNAVGELKNLYTSPIQNLDAPQISGIAQGLFKDCASLVTVNAPNVTSIGAEAFSGCTGLTMVDVSSATTLGISAFKGCKNLATLIVSPLTSLANNLFNGCEKFDYFQTHKDTIKSVGVGTFSGSGLTHFLYDGAGSLPENALSACTSLKTVEIRKLQGAVGSRVFNGCSNLETVIMTGDAYEFADYTFNALTSGKLDFVWGISSSSISKIKFSWDSASFGGGTIINNLFLTEITSQTEASGLKEKLLKTGDNEAYCSAVNNVYYGYTGSTPAATASVAELTAPSNYTKLSP